MIQKNIFHHNQDSTNETHWYVLNTDATGQWLPWFFSGNELCELNTNVDMNAGVTERRLSGTGTQKLLDTFNRRKTYLVLQSLAQSERNLAGNRDREQAFAV